MASQQDYSRLSQVDYCIEQYYSRYLAGDVVKAFNYAEKKRKEEYSRAMEKQSSPFAVAAADQSGIPQFDILNKTSASAFQEGKWSKKSSDDIANAIKNRWYSAKDVRSNDLNALRERFFIELLNREGGVNKFGPKVDSQGQITFTNKRAYVLYDYATSYVERRINSCMVKTLAKGKVPRSSASYIASKAVDESLVGMVLHNAESVRKHSIGGTFDNEVKEKAEKMYNPSFGEKAVAFGGSLALDNEAFRGIGMILRPMTGAALKGTAMAAKTLRMSKGGTVLNRWGSKLLNIDKPVYNQNFFQWMKTSTKDFAVSYGSTAALVGVFKGVPYVAKAIGVNLSTDKERQNLTVFSDKDADTKIINGAAAYRKTGTDLINSINNDLSRRHKIKVGTPTFNMTSKALGNQLLRKSKGYSYGLLQDVTKYFSRQAIPFNANGKVPGWMFGKSSKQLRALSASWYAIAKQMSEKRLETVKLPGGHRASLKEVAQRAYDYARAAVETDRATWKRKEKREMECHPKGGASFKNENRSQRHGHSNTYTETAQYAETGTTAPEYSKAYGNTTATAQPLTGQATSRQETDLSAWQKGLSENGLGDFALNGKNLGYTLAMLPDMLIGMFSGNNPNFKLENNYMPLSMILMSFFMRRKSPMLSLLLMGLGGASLLNNSCKARQTEQQKEALKKKQFLRYADEPLNPRIKNPVVKGRSLVATIDGKPLVITIHNDEPLYCYEQGILPVNVLANSVLKSLDKQETANAISYDMEQGREITNQQQAQIK